MKVGGYPTPEIVPMDSYFIEGDGLIFIRHPLSPRLEQVGGQTPYKMALSFKNLQRYRGR
jgi:hypothetical protein